MKIELNKDYVKISLSELSIIDGNIFSKSYARLLYLEDAILLKVARQVLGRDPEPRDKGDFCIIKRENDLFNYDISYKGTTLGTVTRDIKSDKFSVTFIPAKDGKN